MLWLINKLRITLHCTLSLHSLIQKDSTGPSPRILKWSGGGSHRVPKAREGGEHERGIIPPLVRGVLGGLPREKF